MSNFRKRLNLSLEFQFQDGTSSEAEYSLSLYRSSNSGNAAFLDNPGAFRTFYQQPLMSKFNIYWKNAFPYNCRHVVDKDCNKKGSLFWKSVSINEYLLCQNDPTKPILLVLEEISLNPTDEEEEAPVPTIYTLLTLEDLKSKRVFKWYDQQGNMIHKKSVRAAEVQESSRKNSPRT